MIMEARKDILWRLYLVYIGASIFGLLILYKIFQVQVVEGEQWQQKADDLTTDLRSIEAVRGNIYSDEGRLLAASVPIYEVRMDVNADALTDDIFYDHVGVLADSLSSFFGDKSARDYERELIRARKNGERFHLVKRGVDHNELQKVERFPLFKRGRFKGGFIAIQSNRREKPFKMLASRTIGYEREGVKPVGLEGAFSEHLSGVEGKRLMRKISGGVWKPISDGNEVEPQDGNDLYATIDVNIQDVAENALLRQLKKHDADHGCAVLMEVETGYIKAISNLSRSPDGKGYYEYYNYAVGESTEPGSVFKLPAIMAAMEDGKVDLKDSVDTEDGVFYYYDQPMRDSKKGGYGKITVRKAFEVSSNVGISKTIHRSYSKHPQEFIDRLHKMELGSRLGLRIAGEGRPVIKNTSDDSWSGVSLPWMSIGYEVRLTPLQILTFYNAVANGGKMVKPQFVEKVTKRGKEIRRFEPEVINEAIASRKTVQQAQELLKGVVKRGTAENLKDAEFQIAGKTGTAQIANDKYGYSYDSKVSYQASFVGYFPADDPKYSCIVVVNAPSRDVYYGNLVAGPIFKEIADKVYSSSPALQPPLSEKAMMVEHNVPYTKHGAQHDLQTIFKILDIPYENKAADSEWVVALPRKEQVELDVRKIDARKVPNVVGMGLKDAIFLLENRGLAVKVKGSGRVREQSLSPGTSVQKGRVIRLQLS